MADTATTAAVAPTLIGDALPLGRALHLGLEGWTLRIRSNSDALLDKLARYFAHVTVAETEPDMDVLAIEREAPELDVAFTDWKREPGKTGRKDSYVDLADGRLLRKVRTGMVFLQSETQRIAAGPCLRYDNQVINFINAQYMNWLQHRGWLICHAAGLVRNGRGLGIAGFSGGGKSTLMLHLLEQSGLMATGRLLTTGEIRGFCFLFVAQPHLFKKRFCKMNEVFCNFFLACHTVHQFLFQLVIQSKSLGYSKCHSNDRNDG